PQATFAEFARWERRITAARIGRYADYWRARFGDYFDRPRLPFDQPVKGRPVVTSGESVTATVSAREAARLAGLARQWRLSMTALTGAALLTALHWWSGDPTPAVQVPVPNRPGERYERIVGCFTDEVLLREPVAADEPFAALA